MGRLGGVTCCSGCLLPDWRSARRPLCHVLGGKCICICPFSSTSCRRVCTPAGVSPVRAHRGCLPSLGAWLLYHYAFSLFLEIFLEYWPFVYLAPFYRFNSMSCIFPLTLVNLPQFLLDEPSHHSTPSFSPYPASLPSSALAWTHTGVCACVCVCVCVWERERERECIQNSQVS